MNYDAVEGSEFKIGDRGTMLVRYRVNAVGDQMMADGHVRHVVGCLIEGVAPTEE